MANKKVTVKQAMRAASKRLPIVRDKVLEERLEWAAGTMADAYRIGAEEAQSEIMRRISLLGSGDKIG